MMDLPEPFTKTVIGAFPSGRAWLESLPLLLAECQARWGITVGPHFDLSFNYVAPAMAADGRAVVIKIGVPNRELTTEIKVLQLYAGQGAVRLLDADEEKGLLLLERLVPGCSLSTLSDDEHATRIAARTMRKLWRPLAADNSFPTVEQWANGLKRLRNRFNGDTGPFPVSLVDLAERLFAELLSSTAPPVLLHGDLHHFNVLSAEHGWTAIDPKGVAGEPAYDVGPLLENPSLRLCTDVNIQRRRLEILVDELNIDRERMLAYGVAHAVLSAWWSYEDSGGGWEAACACAQTLASLMHR
jgi:streptomycin 6-kinase